MKNLVKKIVLSGVAAVILSGCFESADYEIKKPTEKEIENLKVEISSSSLTKNRLNQMLQKRNEMVFSENGLAGLFDVFFDNYVKQNPYDQNLINEEIKKQDENFMKLKLEYKAFISDIQNKDLVELTKTKTQLKFIGNQFPIINDWNSKINAEIERRNKEKK